MRQFSFPKHASWTTTLPTWYCKECRDIRDRRLAADVWSVTINIKSKLRSGAEMLSCPKQFQWNSNHLQLPGHISGNLRNKPSWVQSITASGALTICSYYGITAGGEWDRAGEADTQGRWGGYRLFVLWKRPKRWVSWMRYIFHGRQDFN